MALLFRVHGGGGLLPSFLTCGGHKWNFQIILLKFVCFPLFVVFPPHCVATLSLQVGYMSTCGRRKSEK
jgi:hypothetical protein